MLTPLQKSRLMSFLGYGRLDARVWFIGMEEAGGTAAQLLARSRFRPVMDLKVAHARLGISHHHIGRRRLQPTWNMMCRLVLPNNKKKNSTEWRRSYQAGKLGRNFGDTFLTELLPIPVPKVSEWPLYLSENLGVDRTAYMAQQLPKRRELLATTIRKNDVKIVIAYGRGRAGDPTWDYWQHIKSIFPRRNFNQYGGIQYSSGTPFVILTPHLSRLTNKRINEIRMLLTKNRRVSSLQKVDLKKTTLKNVHAWPKRSKLSPWPIRSQSFH